MPRERLILNLDRSVPGFAEYLGSDANLFASATPAAIFAACSHFVRDRPIDSEHWHALVNLVNDVVAGPDESVAEGRAPYFGIRPLSEWTEVGLSERRFLFDEPMPEALVISYHDNGDYFLVLDTQENSFTWYDLQDFRDTRTVKHSVGELLDWWWELAQELDPRRDAAGQLRLAADEGIADAQPSQLNP